MVKKSFLIVICFILSNSSAIADKEYGKNEYRIKRERTAHHFLGFQIQDAFDQINREFEVGDPDNAFTCSQAIDGQDRINQRLIFETVEDLTVEETVSLQSYWLIANIACHDLLYAPRIEDMIDLMLIDQSKT